MDKGEKLKQESEMSDDKLGSVAGGWGTYKLTCKCGSSDIIVKGVKQENCDFRCYYKCKICGYEWSVSC